MSNKHRIRRMATAICQNGDCEKDDWTLRKAPHEYARGGPSCPECGTSRVAIEGGEETPTASAGAQQEAPTQAQAAPQQGQSLQGEPRGPGGQQPEQQAIQPAQQGQQSQGNLPSTEGAMQTGMNAASMIAGLSSDDPEKKAEATGSLMKSAGMAVAQLGDHKEQQIKEQTQRAKQTSNDQIRKAQEYPECPECQGQITGIPESGEFACPHCETLLTV